MASYKLAELLLRRKELNEKVAQLGKIKASDLFEVKVKRVNVTDSVDDITATVPKLTVSQVTAEYDHYAKQLRLVDALIQSTNWTVDINTDNNVMGAYEAPK